MWLVAFRQKKDTSAHEYGEMAKFLFAQEMRQRKTKTNNYEKQRKSYSSAQAHYDFFPFTNADTYFNCIFSFENR